MIKVSGLIYKREKQSDPRTAWLMLQKVYKMNCDINKKYDNNAAILLTRIIEHKQAKKVNK